MDRSDGLPRPQRRGVLAAASGIVAALAGCTTAGNGGGNGGDGSDGDDGGSDDSDDGSDGGGGSDDGEGGDDGLDETTTGSTTPPNENLDLREANVTGVAITRRDGEVRFEVTLYHDDDGEDGYANWWQVERLTGEQIGRRDLLHPHGTREFTRSDTFAIPDGVTRVVVRGHDQTHGYGGQAAIVDLQTGAVTFVRQGPDPTDFSDRG